MSQVILSHVGSERQYTDGHPRAATAVCRKTGKIALSIKALEIAEEKEAVAAYGSSDSGASLGDILGAALKDREKR